MRHKLRVSWFWYILIIAVLILSWLLSHDYLATATFGLAFVTFLLVLETIETRVQAETRRKELAFRAALVELADNIINYRRWNLLMLLTRKDPDPYWWDHPLQFTRLNELLGSVDVAPQLFTWITGKRGNIQVREGQLRTDLRRASELSTDERNRLMGKALWLDLYLVQLACYVVCEAKRQGFYKMADSMEQAGTLKPSPWGYGSSPDEPPGVTAALSRVVELWWPAMSTLPEPDIPGCEQCKLEKLIQLAHQELEQLFSRIKGSDTGIEVAPGDFI